MNPADAHNVPVSLKKPEVHHPPSWIIAEHEALVAQGLRGHL